MAHPSPITVRRDTVLPRRTRGGAGSFNQLHEKGKGGRRVVAQKQLHLTTSTSTSS